MVDLRHLPGGTLVQRGLHDLASDTRSAEALAVAACGTRLRGAGIEVPSPAWLPEELELTLYATLQADPTGDAYARYNAIRREIDSFLNAID